MTQSILSDRQSLSTLITQLEETRLVAGKGTNTNKHDGESLSDCDSAVLISHSDTWTRFQRKGEYGGIIVGKLSIIKNGCKIGVKSVKQTSEE